MVTLSAKAAERLKAATPDNDNKAFRIIVTGIG